MIMKSVGFLEDIRSIVPRSETKRHELEDYSTFISRVLKLFH